MKGVYYLHSKGIVHGDLKVSNVMIENSWEDLPEEELGQFESNDGSTRLFPGIGASPNGREGPGTSESPWSSRSSPYDKAMFSDEGLSTSSKKCDLYCLIFGITFRDKSNEHSFQQKRASIIEKNENRVRIIDFGVSYNSNNTFDWLSLFMNSESSIYGTPMSMPPEVYNSTIITTAKATLWKRHGRKAAASFNFGMARDIWSLGVLL